jgi:hypothetical protein
MGQKPVFEKIMQVAVVVRDIDASVRKWSDVYGIGPWSIYELGPGSITWGWLPRRGRTLARCFLAEALKLCSRVGGATKSGPTTTPARISVSFSSSSSERAQAISSPRSRMKNTQATGPSHELEADERARVAVCVRPI